MVSSTIQSGASVSSPESPKEALIALFLRRALLGSTILVAIGLPAAPFITFNHKVATAYVLAIAVFMLAPSALLLRSGRVTQATWAFLTGGAIMATLLVILSAGAHGQPFQAAIAVLGMVLLNRNAAIIFATIALLADLGVALFQTTGGHLPAILPGTPLGTWLSLALVVALVLPTIDRTMSQLHESEERFRGAFRLNPEGIVIATRDGRFLEFNDAFLRLTEFSRPELIGNGSALADFFADARECATFFVKLAGNKRLGECDAELRTKTGSSRYVQISAEPIRLLEADCLLIIIRDTTRQRLLEDRLRRVYKMEALGRLAKGVVHRFSEALAVVSASAEMLETLISTEPAHYYMRRISDTTASSTVLLKQLLAFTRQQSLRPRILDLNVVLEILWDRMLQPIRSSVAATLLLQDDLGKVSVDCEQIEQVILSLAANARDAMPKGGELTIRTADAELDQQFVLQHGGKVAAESYVMLAVADTGMGMAPEVKERIFEPFFTTKGPEHATGLGLAMAYGIVEQSGGFIVVDSEQGKGSTFTVYLPRVPYTMDCAA